MGIYIKGMEMPTNCGVCRFAGSCGVHNIEEWPDLESIILNDVIGIDGVRDADCPLVPVPPHGRLIDADAYEALICGLGNREYRRGNGTICDAIKFLHPCYAPTVIEAEEGE